MLAGVTLKVEFCSSSVWMYMSGGEIGCLRQSRFQKFWFYWSICIILKRDISITRIALPSFPLKFCSWSWWFLNFPTSEIFIFFFQVFTAFKVIKFEDWSVLKNARHLLVWAYHERLMCMSIRERSVQADMAIFSTKLSNQKTIFCSSQGISNTENTRDHDAELATK